MRSVEAVMSGYSVFPIAMKFMQEGLL
jgi:hypothetical protein